MTRKICIACEREVVGGFWYREYAGEPKVWCHRCAPDIVRRIGVRDDGRPGTEFMVIDVILATDTMCEVIGSMLEVLEGSSDDELLDAAKSRVAELWPDYRVIDAGPAGCCEIRHDYYMTCRHACITVMPAHESQREVF
jgi:hypothetical protein